MKRITVIAAALLLAFLAVLSTHVAAQDTNTQQRSFLTFSGPVELPGVTLEPGTYVFRLADTPSRNVVQVLSEDEKDVKGQWTFVQAERPEATGDTVIMFREAREGTTPAVQYWYYPGERIGKEFIYPKDQATKIASRTCSAVLTDEGRVAGNGLPPSGDVADSTLRNAPAPAQPTGAAGSLSGNRGLPEQPAPETSVATAGSTANQGVGTSGAATPQPVDRGEPSTSASSSSVQQESTQASASELPQTASPLPLTGLIGLLSLGAAFASRRLAASRG